MQNGKKEEVGGGEGGLESASPLLSPVAWSAAVCAVGLLLVLFIRTRSIKPKPQTIVHVKDYDPANMTQEELVDIFGPSENQIVHLKGYASDVDLSIPLNSDSFSSVVASLVHLEPHYIIFDGDNYAPDSFTHCLVLYHKHCIQNNIRPARFVAFTCQGDAERCAASWQGKIDSLKIVQCTHIPKGAYAKLGHCALSLTKAKGVVVLNGGSCIGDEIAMASENLSTNDVRFYVWNVVRRRSTPDFIADKFRKNDRVVAMKGHLNIRA